MHTRKVSLPNLPYNGKILTKEGCLWANNLGKDNLLYLEPKDFQIEWKWNMKEKKGDINSTLLVHIEAKKDQIVFNKKWLDLLDIMNM